MAQISHVERITVVVAPEQIEAGQMIQIAAAVTDKFGTPIVAKTLYMEILDSKGRVYWPLSPIERNVSSFAKLIATNEMKHNTRYQVRVSTNRHLSPMGYGFFKTKKNKLPLGIIPALMVTGILVPSNNLIPEGAKHPTFEEAQQRIKHIDQLMEDAHATQDLQNIELIKKLEQEKEILKKVKQIMATYKTELDHRVCPICKPNEGLTFPINDPNIIKIGPPDLGGDTHYGCRCHYDIEHAINAAVAKIERMLKSILIVKAVQAVRKHKALQVVNNT